MCIVVKIKRVFVCFFAAVILFAALGAAYLHGVAEEGLQLPILMYHSVLKDTSRTGKYIVTPRQIEEDIEYLTARGYKCVSAENVINHVLHGEPLPEKPYMLTFDDGSYNNLTYVLPILEKYNAYAVISIVGSYSEQFSETGEANPAYSYLRWEDIKSLAETGRIEFGNHSYDMHSISNGRIGSARARGEDKWVYIDKFTRDYERTQSLLAENCNITPVIYTYPYGAYCDESQEILHNGGIIMTLTCNEGINTLTSDSDCLYFMKRFNRSGDLICSDFFERCGIK